MDIEDLGEFDLSEKRSRRIVKVLLKWYSENKRDLPWRKNHENTQVHAYKVWVSEIMSQQTRIATVISYYKKWMKKFPTLKSLSSASLEDVNAMWSGLGYYSRAKNLWRASQIVMERHDGIIPSDPKQLENLPGIGRYTAGAISSIVFGIRSPVVDGNVKRVISRIQSISLPDSSKREKLFWKLATKLVKCEAHSIPGDLNQALMEFGALRCSPKSPKCVGCPFNRKKRLCKAYGELNSGDIESVEIYPIKTKRKKKVPIQHLVVCIIEREFLPKEVNQDEEEEFRIKKKKKMKNATKVHWVTRKRPKKGVILAGLYEFPNYQKTQLEMDKENEVVEEEEEEEDEIDRKREFKIFCDGFEEEYGIRIDQNQGFFCGTVLHKFSHLHQYFSVYRYLCDDSLEELIRLKCENLQANLEWMNRERFGKSGVSTLTKKILKEREKGKEFKVSTKRKRQQKISQMFKKKKKQKKKRKLK